MKHSAARRVARHAIDVMRDGGDRSSLRLWLEHKEDRGGGGHRTSTCDAGRRAAFPLDGHVVLVVSAAARRGLFDERLGRGRNAARADHGQQDGDEASGPAHATSNCHTRHPEATTHPRGACGTGRPALVGRIVSGSSGTRDTPRGAVPEQPWPEPVGSSDPPAAAEAYRACEPAGLRSNTRTPSWTIRTTRSPSSPPTFSDRSDSLAPVWCLLEPRLPRRGLEDLQGENAESFLEWRPQDVRPPPHLGRLSVDFSRLPCATAIGSRPARNGVKPGMSRGRRRATCHFLSDERQ